MIRPIIAPVTIRTFYNKGEKKRAERIVDLYKHEGIFKNTREGPREAWAMDECFLDFSSVPKNS